MGQSEELEEQAERGEQIEKFGQLLLPQGEPKAQGSAEAEPTEAEPTEAEPTEAEPAIQLITVIGEIEGHECLSQNTKTTKYEHVLPLLANVEDSREIDGLLLLLNTVGGDVESGLAIAEMVASISKPTVSLVLGGSHSIGGPLAVSTDYSFIVPTGTMIIHPVRLNGTIIGAPPTYDYFKRIQERITGFMEQHSRARKERLQQMMINTGMLSKDLGTILVGQEAVDEGLIDEVGGIREAIAKLRSMIREQKIEKENKTEAT